MARTKQTARKEPEKIKKTPNTKNGGKITKNSKQVVKKVPKDVPKDVPKIIKDNGEKKERKKHRARPGSVIKREIRKEQLSIKNLIPKAPFNRLVRDVTHDHRYNQILKDNNPNEEYGGIRWQRTAINDLLMGCQDYLIDVLKTSWKGTEHCNRQTLMVKDLRLFYDNHLNNNNDNYSHDKKRMTNNSSVNLFKKPKKKPKKLKEPQPTENTDDNNNNMDTSSNQSDENNTDNNNNQNTNTDTQNENNIDFDLS